jgi:hypothetical protein
MSLYSWLRQKELDPVLAAMAHVHRCTVAGVVEPEDPVADL